MTCLLSLAYAGLATIIAYTIIQGITYLCVPVVLEALGGKVSGDRAE